MTTHCRHNISIYDDLFQKITELAKIEKRSTTKMAEILLEQALVTRTLEN